MRGRRRRCRSSAPSSCARRACRPGRPAEASQPAPERGPRRRELAILRTAAVTGAEYEWVQHQAIARGVGASEEQIAAVRAGELDAASLDEDDRLVLRCAEELLRNDAIGKATFAAAR